MPGTSGSPGDPEGPRNPRNECQAVAEWSFVERLKERKLIEWAVAYLAGAWLAIQVLDILGERFGWPDPVLRALIVLLGFGLLVTLVLAWYHGETGRQRIGGTELFLVAAVLVLAAITISRVTRGVPAADQLDALVRLPEAIAAPVPRLNQPIRRGGPSVAVLPFRDLSRDVDGQYLADGIHDDVLNHLAQVGGLTVISRQSVLRYRDSDVAISHIGAALGVGAVLEGSVRREGSRIRVVAQLIDVPTDTHLWSRSYDRYLDDVFSVQSEIAREVALALEATLTPAEAKRIARPPSGSLTAYDFYVQGRAAYRTYTGEGIEEAIRLFRRALDTDSTYAEAWAGLGDAYGQRRLRFGYGYEWSDSAVAAAQKAIDLDPGLANAHKALGLALGTKGWMRKAIASYLTALELSPSHSGALNNISSAYSALNVYDEALRWRRRLLEVNPNTPFARINAAIQYANLGEREIAQHWLDDAFELNPDDGLALAAQAHVYLRWGELEQSVAIRESLSQRDPDDVDWLVEAAQTHTYARDYPSALRRVDEAFQKAPDGLLLSIKWATTIAGFAHLQMGDSKRARALLTQSLHINQSDLDGGLDMPRAPWENASILAALGRTDEAISWAALAYRMGHRRFWDADLDPMFDSIRDEPRFVALVDSMRADIEAMRARVVAEETALGLR